MTVWKEIIGGRHGESHTHDGHAGWWQVGQCQQVEDRLLD